MSAVLVHALMGAAYGVLVTYGPWTGARSGGWQEAVQSGVLFALVLGLCEQVWAWRRRSRQRPARRGADSADGTAPPGAAGARSRT